MIDSDILRIMMSSFYVQIAKALVRLHVYAGLMPVLLLPIDWVAYTCISGGSRTTYAGGA